MNTRRNDETRLHLPMDAGSEQEVLDRLADDFLSRMRNGERPSIESYQDQFPDLAEEIEEVLTSVAMIEDLKRQSDSLPGNSAKKWDIGDLERIGDYKIVAELGRGGMGVVFQAVHESLGRQVAIKILPGKVFDQTTLDRFHKEAQAAANLHHSNIVNVFGVGEENGLHYYVMEFVEGVSFADLIHFLKQQPRTRSDASTPPEIPTRETVSEKNESKLGAQPASPQKESVINDIDWIPQFQGNLHRYRWSAELVAQIADGLEYSHGRMILHRDIKPGNFLLDKTGKPWITDFGLVKMLAEQTMTQTGNLFGTPQYLAPESLEGTYNQRSEVYCLGVTMYELVTLSPAYDQSTPTEVLKSIASSNPKSLRMIARDLPVDLRTIIEKAIDRDPASRYGSAAELRDDLNRFLQDRPIAARPVSNVEKAWRWSKRNPLPAALGSLSLLLVSNSSRTPSWAFLVASDSVSTTMPSLTVSMHDGCRPMPRPVSTSTRHMRHMPTGFMRGW